MLKTCCEQLTLAIEQANNALSQLQLQGKDKNVLDGVRGSLAEVAMKLKLQAKLAGQTQVATPAAEPPGRAPDGQAFTR